MNQFQSLQSQLHQLLPQENQELDDRTIKTSVLKIIKNTIVFDNTVYQINNVSTVALADFTKKQYINQSVPVWYWLLLGAGVVTLFIGVGIIILIFVAWLFYKHSQLEKTKTIEKYGLRIRMTSGEETILVSKNKDFVLKIVLALYNIINSDEPKAIRFNFETLNIDKIEDKSISIEKSYGSSVVSGQVEGDVVNNI